jgi:general stress protein 26
MIAGVAPKETKKMNPKILKRASDLINSKKDYIGDGMGGYAVLTLNDESGYPASSTLTISKADGINWLSFISDSEGTKAKRIKHSNKACVCLASSEYNITLTGTAELITDPAVKKQHWQSIFSEAYNADPQNPEYAVLLFTTEHYNIFFASDDTEAKGAL